MLCSSSLLFFVVTLFPALGLFDVYPFRFSYVADHFQDLASIGPIVLWAAASTRAVGGLGAERVLPAMTCAIALALGLLTCAQARWPRRSSGRVGWGAIRHDRASRRLRDGLALEYAGRVVEAVVRRSLGRALQRLGRHAAAAVEYCASLVLDPSSAETHNDLGVALAELGRRQEAVDAFESAARREHRIRGRADRVHGRSGRAEIRSLGSPESAFLN